MEILLDKIFNEVDIRSFYSGEFSKKELPEISFVQTSSDNRDILFSFVSEAVYNIARFFCDKVKFDFEEIEDGFVLDFKIENSLKKKLLDNLIKKYVSIYTYYHWLLNVYPDYSKTVESMVLKSWDELSSMRTSLGAKVRRRATDLAGI